MEEQQFTSLVARLERLSAQHPTRYRARVLGLTLVGFGILLLLFGAVTLGLLLLAGLALAMVLSGGSALLWLFKLGKLLVLFAYPLWQLVRSGVKALSVRLPAPTGHEIARVDAPALFAALDRMQLAMKGPRFHHVLIVDDINAAVVQRPAFGLIGWPRNYLVLGLPLLEGLSSEEALAVVAHEYGHLAGSHGRFSAFIYRLRHTWGTVQDHAEQVRGWIAKAVQPLVRWYAPYFNAYTFVLARADEYQADAAAVALVGPTAMAHALKRVNLATAQHRRFMQQVFDRVDHEAVPPSDLLTRWADQATVAVDAPTARQSLDQALDREGHVTDTHPTLRHRLAALPALPEAPEDLPPPVDGPTAAQAWLGPLLERLRALGQARWVEQVSAPWLERHAKAQQQRERLAELRALEAPSTDEQIELLRLAIWLEPSPDHLDALVAFNATHVDHPGGLFTEGLLRLDRDDPAGLTLIDRAMALDPQAVKAGCERAHAFLTARGDREAARAYAERWQTRDAWETERARQLRVFDSDHALVSHGLAADVIDTLRNRLDKATLKHVQALYLARRVIPIDPQAVQWVMGVKLTYWGKWRQQQSVVRRLAAMDTPVPFVIVALTGEFAVMEKKFRALADAKIA